MSRDTRRSGTVLGVVGRLGLGVLRRSGVLGRAKPSRDAHGRPKTLCPVLRRPRLGTLPSVLGHPTVAGRFRPSWDTTCSRARFACRVASLASLAGGSPVARFARLPLASLAALLLASHAPSLLGSLHSPCFSPCFSPCLMLSLRSPLRHDPHAYPSARLAACIFTPWPPSLLEAVVWREEKRRESRRAGLRWMRTINLNDCTRDAGLMSVEGVHIC